MLCCCVRNVADPAPFNFFKVFSVPQCGCKCCVILVVAIVIVVVVKLVVVWCCCDFCVVVMFCVDGMCSGC